MCEHFRPQSPDQAQKSQAAKDQEPFEAKVSACVARPTGQSTSAEHIVHGADGGGNSAAGLTLQGLPPLFMFSQSLGPSRPAICRKPCTKAWISTKKLMTQTLTLMRGVGRILWEGWGFSPIPFSVWFGTGRAVNRDVWSGVSLFIRARGQQECQEGVGSRICSRMAVGQLEVRSESSQTTRQAPHTRVAHR